MGGGSGMMMFGHLKHAKKALGLSDQQATDIKKIFTDVSKSYKLADAKETK